MVRPHSVQPQKDLQRLPAVVSVISGSSSHLSPETCSTTLRPSAGSWLSVSGWRRLGEPKGLPIGWQSDRTHRNLTEERMSRQLISFATAAILAGSAWGGAASAGPMPGFAGLTSANTALRPIEKTQFVWGGYDYCWYDDGWQGPGWYVCDYGPWVSGYWWGGPSGWHDWRWSGPVLRGPYHVDRGDLRGGRNFEPGHNRGDRFVAPRGAVGAGGGGGGR